MKGLNNTCKKFVIFEGYVPENSQMLELYMKPEYGEYPMIQVWDENYSIIELSIAIDIEKNRILIRYGPAAEDMFLKIILISSEEISEEYKATVYKAPEDLDELIDF